VDQFVANFLLSRVLGFQNSIRWKVEQRGGREERGEEHKAIWQDREGVNVCQSTKSRDLLRFATLSSHKVLRGLDKGRNRTVFAITCGNIHSSPSLAHLLLI